VDFADDLGPGVRNLINNRASVFRMGRKRRRKRIQRAALRRPEEESGGHRGCEDEPIQKRYGEIVAEPGYVADVLRSGAERFPPLANATVEVVKQRMGLYTAG